VVSYASPGSAGGAAAAALNSSRRENERVNVVQTVVVKPKTEKEIEEDRRNIRYVAYIFGGGISILGMIVIVLNLAYREGKKYDA